MSDVVRESAVVFGANVRKMTVDEYYLAADTGVFDPSEKLELLRGEVVTRVTQNSPHAWATARLVDLLREISPQGVLRCQAPLRLDEFNEPEPDVVLAIGPHENYMHRHPAPANTLLVVEVADTSLRTDRNLKGPLYAEFGIPEYWILDLKGRRLEVYREPMRDAEGKGAYAVSEIFGNEGMVVPLNGDGGEIAVSDLLPS